MAYGDDDLDEDLGGSDDGLFAFANQLPTWRMREPAMGRLNLLSPFPWTTVVGKISLGRFTVLKKYNIPGKSQRQSTP